MHDPTQVNRQGPDVGTQYRSAIFTHSEAQSGVGGILTRSRPGHASTARSRPRSQTPAAFYPAEDYHQRYYEQTGHEPYCHVLPVGLLERLGLVRSA